MILRIHVFFRLLFFQLFFCPLFSFGESSVEVFDNVEPTIAFIGNIEGFGSGVMVSPDGLILTNYHVVNSALPLTVKAKAKHDSGYVEREYKKITVYKVHPKYDLALVKIEDANGAVFPFLKLDKVNVETGSTCYVIGNPNGGNGEVMRNSITEGLISSNERLIKKLKYLQVSAATNPGNSGGAVVNSEGQLIGLVTLKSKEAESIAFAIPSSEFSLDEFVLSNEKKSNENQGQVYKQKGDDLYNYANSFYDYKTIVVYLKEALKFYELALSEMPNDGIINLKVGRVYFKINEYTSASPYLEKALTLSPKNVEILDMMGHVAEKKGETEQALKYWLKGAFLQEKDRTLCINSAATYQFIAGNHTQAAYLFKLFVLLDRGGVSGPREYELLGKSLNKIDPLVAKFIRDKKDQSDFSLSEYEKIQLRSQEIRDTNDKEITRNRQLELRDEQVFRKVFLRRTGKAPILDGWVSKKLEGEVTNIIPVFGGAYLAIATKELKSVILFDTLSAKSVKHLPVASNDFLMAAANDKLVVYHPKMRICETFSLISMKKEKAKRLKEEVAITLFEMGLNYPSKAFISYSKEMTRTSKRYYGFLNLHTMEIEPLTPVPHEDQHAFGPGFQRDYYGDSIEGTVNKDLTRVALWSESSSPKGFTFVKINKENNTCMVSYEHNDYGTLAISSDSNYTFSTGGTIFEKGNTILKQYRDLNLFRVIDGNFFIKNDSEKKQLSVCEIFSQTTLMSYDWPVEFKLSGSFVRKSLPIYKYVVASALLNRLTIYDDKTNQFYVHELFPQGMIKGLSNSINNKLVIQAGDTWKFNLLLPDGFSARLEDAPTGMVLKNGELTWKTPANASKGVVEILLGQRDSNGNENFRILKLQVL